MHKTTWEVVLNLISSSKNLIFWFGTNFFSLYPVQPYKYSKIVNCSQTNFFQKCHHFAQCNFKCLELERFDKHRKTSEGIIIDIVSLFSSHGKTFLVMQETCF